MKNNQSETKITSKTAHKNKKNSIEKHPIIKTTSNFSEAT